MNFYTDALKEHIRAGRLEVINLTLTSDNRLVSKKLQQHVRKPEIPTLEVFKTKAESLGFKLEKAYTHCGRYVYFALKDDCVLLYIPDDVTYIYSNCDYMGGAYFDIMLKNFNNLKVYGGKGLKRTSWMFTACYIKNIDLQNFDTSNVTDASGMFAGCESESIDLSNLNTAKITNMSEMFSECRCKNIDLSKFNTSNVTNMEFMFYNCRFNKLNIYMD